jgi:AcrR family transcriptional regulator
MALPAPAARPPRLSPDEVLRAARRIFLATGTIEMRSLARELGIGRATLYRWRGGREALLSEVILSLGMANLRRAEADTPEPPGAERLCAVHDLHLRRISDSPAMRAFIRSEPEVASRVLLDGAGVVHVGVTRALADLIRRQEEQSRWRAPLEPDALAPAISRLSEAFLYSDLIAHDRPDVATADFVLRLMLGVSRGAGERPPAR